MNYNDYDQQNSDENGGNEILEERREKPDLAATLAAMQTSDGPDTTIFYGLSDLTQSEIAEFEKTWSRLNDETRQRIIHELIDVGEANFELSYTAIALSVLDDPDSDVRGAAIELLWENEDESTLHRLLEIAQWDESTEVRAAATTAVGRFILMGELGDFSETEAMRAQDIVISILNSEDEEIDVRRRALEAISNSSHEIVESAIRDAYESHEHKMRVSAVFAMGRSADDHWTSTVLRELDSDDPEIRYEAARAAGELMIEDAVPALSRMAFDSDRELQNNAVWSLGEIGGREALRVLNLVAANAQETDDADLIEAVEDALASATLGGDMLDLLRYNSERDDDVNELDEE